MPAIPGYLGAGHIRQGHSAALSARKIVTRPADSGISGRADVGDALRGPHRCEAISRYFGHSSGPTSCSTRAWNFSGPSTGCSLFAGVAGFQGGAGQPSEPKHLHDNGDRGERDHHEIQNSADGSHVALSGFLRTGFSFSNRDPRPRPGLPFEDAIHRLGLRQRGAFDRGYVLQMNPDVRDSERAAHVAVGGKVLCRGKRSHVTAITPRETNTVTYGI